MNVYNKLVRTNILEIIAKHNDIIYISRQAYTTISHPNIYLTLTQYFELCKKSSMSVFYPSYKL